MRNIENAPIGMGSVRVYLVFLLVFINLVLSNFRYHTISKINLIFLSPFIFLIFPTLVGFVEEESFTYYPFTVIGFSITPMLLLTPGVEKVLFRIAMIYYFVMLLFIDALLLKFTPVHYPILDILPDFFIYYKAAHIAIFAFINASVYYLRKLNLKYEEEVNKANQELDHQNDELKTALEHLRTTEHQLIESEKMASLGTLVAGVAHEMNNPLNYITGGVDMLEDEMLGESNENIKSDRNSYSAVHIIKQGVERATGIVRALMTFSQKGAQEKKLTDLNEIIENTLLFLKYKIPYEIRISKNYNLQEKVMVYQEKIHQIVHNILDNAIYVISKSDKAKGEAILINTLSEIDEGKKSAIIEIINRGPGIPDNILKQIFDPFFTTKEPGEGAGLGLSAAYTYIKEHNGNIVVKNVKDGVSFKVYLPVE